MAEYMPPPGPHAGPNAPPNAGPPPGARGGMGGAPMGYPAMSPQPTSGVPADVSSRRILVGVLAIVLGVMGIGFIGVHKFILGYTKPGVIMLLVGIFGCGIGWIVMNVISIIEGIIYLTRSDEQFYRTYVLQRKEWF